MTGIFKGEINAKTIREFIGHTADLSPTEDISREYMIRVLEDIVDYVEFLEDGR